VLYLQRRQHYCALRSRHCLATAGYRRVRTLSPLLCGRDPSTKFNGSAWVNGMIRHLLLLSLVSVLSIGCGCLHRHHCCKHRHKSHHKCGQNQCIPAAPLYPGDTFAGGCGTCDTCTGMGPIYGPITSIDCGCGAPVDCGCQAPVDCGCQAPQTVYSMPQYGTPVPSPVAPAVPTLPPDAAGMTAPIPPGYQYDASRQALSPRTQEFHAPVDATPPAAGSGLQQTSFVIPPGNVLPEIPYVSPPSDAGASR
jgi:hypothetical protein